jgi:hypothetical protein
MKIYEYKGKHYCEEDLSLTDDDYAGDLYDLYWKLREDGKAYERTSYYTEGSSSTYCEAEELVEEEFADLVIGEV